MTSIRPSARLFIKRFYWCLKDVWAVLRIARGHKRFPLTKRIWISVYWKDVEAGKGVAIALKFCGLPAVRFDCFGERGHFHVLPNFLHRHSFSSARIPNQIDQSFKTLREDFRQYADSQNLVTYPVAELDGEHLGIVLNIGR